MGPSPQRPNSVSDPTRIDAEGAERPEGVQVQAKVANEPKIGPASGQRQLHSTVTIEDVPEDGEDEESTHLNDAHADVCPNATVCSADAADVRSNAADLRRTADARLDANAHARLNASADARSNEGVPQAPSAPATQENRAVRALAFAVAKSS
jgi:hypothetical protein